MSISTVLKDDIKRQYDESKVKDEDWVTKCQQEYMDEHSQEIPISSVYI